jgi:hypothetical protein
MRAHFISSFLLKSFAIFGGSFFDHILWQTRRRRCFDLIERLEIIAHELLVEAGRAGSHGVLVLRPEARRVRREAFVNQKKFVVRRADLEFGIGNGSSALRRIIDKVTPIPVQ